MRTNFILNGDPKEQHVRVSLDLLSFGVLGCKLDAEEFSNSKLRLASICKSHRNCECKTAETIERVLTEMLQVGAAFFTLSKRIDLHYPFFFLRAAYQCSWSEGVFWFWRVLMPTLFLVLVQISAGLICYSSVHNWGKYIKLLRWYSITRGAPPRPKHAYCKNFWVLKASRVGIVSPTQLTSLLKINQSQLWKWCLPLLNLSRLKVRRRRFQFRPRLKLLSAHWWEGGFSQAACTDGLDSQKAGERKGKERTG